MTQKKKPLSLYPDDELRSRIEQLAERERRSVNAQCLLLLETHPDLATPLQFRSIAINGDEATDMVTGERVEPTTLQPLRVYRPTTCPHEKDIYTYCEVCDG